MTTNDRAEAHGADPMTPHPSTHTPNARPERAGSCTMSTQETWTETHARIGALVTQRDAALREAGSLRLQLQDAERRLRSMAAIPVQLVRFDTREEVGPLYYLPTLPREGEPVEVCDWSDLRAEAERWQVLRVEHNLNPETGSYSAHVIVTNPRRGAR